MIDERFPLDYESCVDRLGLRLEEKAPSHIQILTGPRQVGKTTLLLELAKRFGDRAIYAAADAPEAAVPGFWERLWARAEDVGAAGGGPILLLDEVQHFPGWSVRLKGEWDRLRRRRLPIHVVVTGSSALRVGAGSRESLAGRFERLSLSHWSAGTLARVFGLAPAEAARLVVRMGSYPGSMEFRKDPARWAAYVRDAIVEPAVAKDILALADVRRPALLRQVMAVAAASPAHILSLQKIQGRIQDAGALETLSHYLEVLEEAYLVVTLRKHSSRPVRSRAAPPKLIPLSNAFLAVLDPRGIPDPAREPERHGFWVENACLAFAWNSGQRVSYWREEPWEVDGVIEGSWGRWAVEVKTGAYGPSDLRGMLEFTRRFPGFRPLVLCDVGQETPASRVGLAALPWERYLLEGPPSA